jgi:predicted dehydrogenase
VLIPAFKNGGASLETLASSGGVSSSVVGAQQGFRKATSDSSSVFEDPSIDTIVVATRHDTHADMATKALEAGKNVFVEKPLAMTHEELDRVEQAARTSRGKLAVGFNRRYAPHVQRAKQAIAHRSGPVTIAITVNAGAIPKEHWTQDAGSGGGRIVGECCHFLDLARFLAGSQATSLQVTTAKRGAEPIDDIALCQIGFADGSLATVQYLANGNKAYPKERIELFFDGKVIRLDNYRKIDAWGVDHLKVRWPDKQDKGHAAFAAAFINAVKTGSEPPVGLEELLEVSRLSIEAAQLARNGGGVWMASQPSAQLPSARHTLTPPSTHAIRSRNKVGH